MADQSDAVLAYWSEHRQQLRQSEEQRAVLTNYILVIASALTGLIAQQKLALDTLPVAILLMLLGTYGAITVAKYHERAEYHLTQARALTKTLTRHGVLPEFWMNIAGGTTTNTPGCTASACTCCGLVCTQPSP